MNKPSSELIALADRLKAECEVRENHPDDYCPDLTCMFRECEAALRTAARVDALREALRNLLDYAEQNECSHETTYRGGSIWTICDECGKKWADDRGGFIPYQEPKEITRARAALHSPKIAAAETSPGDVIAVKEALARAFCVAKGINPDCLHQNYDDEPVDQTDAHGRTFHFGWRNQLHLVDAALPFIDRLDVKAEAKSQEAEAVTIKPLEWYEEPLRNHKNPAWNATTDFGSNYRVFKAWRGKEKKAGWIGNGEFHNTEAEAKAAAQSDYEQRIRSALIHPTTKPEAPAVGVDAETIDAVARIIDPTAWKMEHGYWMEQAHAYEAISKATAIAALIAGER